MISILEPLCYGLEHAAVNAGIAAIARRAFPDESIAFYAQEQHLCEVRAGLQDADVSAIRWCPLGVPPRAADFGDRWRLDFSLLKQVVQANARAGRHGHVLCLQSIPSILGAAAALRTARIARQPILAVLHNYLNEAFGWRSRNPFMRAVDMRSALGLAKSCVRLIALEPGIADAVADALP